MKTFRIAGESNGCFEWCDRSINSKLILIQDEEVVLLNQIEDMTEATIQDLVFKYPSCLPISEIDESFNPVLFVCTELNTPVGPLDILMVSLC